MAKTKFNPIIVVLIILVFVVIAKQKGFMGAEICPDYTLGKTVIFRTNNVYGTYYNELNNWVAIDRDGDGQLEGWLYDSYSLGSCVGRGGDVITTTLEGYEIKKEIGYGEDILICGAADSNQDVEFAGPQTIGELSTLPIYPYCANNQEIYSEPTICSDGTPFNTCSSTKPLYCDNGNLINRCSVCGCNIGFICSDEQCVQGSNLRLKNIVNARVSGITGFGNYPTGSLLRLFIVGDGVAPYYPFGTYDLSGYIDGEVTDPGQQPSTDDMLMVKVYDTVQTLNFNSGILQIDYVSDNGSVNNFNIYFPNGLNNLKSFYVSVTGETYYDLALTQSACTTANGCILTSCTIPGDTAPCNVITRSELGTIINNWISGSVTRIDLGTAIQAWVNG